MPNSNQRLTHQNIIGDFLSIAMLIIVNLAMYSWVFRDDTYFFVDDWGWLDRATFTPWRDYLSWWTALPAALFMDRPIAGMAIHGLYSIFNLNHFGFSVATLGVHILNSILIYFIGKKVLGFKFDGLIASTLFAINPYISYPVWWVATIHDSLALLFCLSSFLAFIANKKYGIYLACFFYYLATRSKEASLPFPLILIIYEFLLPLNAHKSISYINRLKETIKSTWPILLLFAFLISFYGFYFIQHKVHGDDFGPYLPKFSGTTLANGLDFYLKLISYNFFEGRTVFVLCAIFLFLATIFKNKLIVFFLISFFVASSPVLVLGTQRVPYYAYLPAPWFCLFIAAIYSALRIKIANRTNEMFSSHLNFIAFLILGSLCAFILNTENISRPTLEVMKENKKAQISLMNKIIEVKEGTNFVILGVPNGPISFFAYAPCTAIKVLYKVQKITCAIQRDDTTLIKEYQSLNSPKILLNYNKGEIVLLEKKED